MARDYSFRHAPSTRTIAPRQATPVVVPSRSQHSSNNVKAVSSFDMTTPSRHAMSVAAMANESSVAFSAVLSAPVTVQSMEFVRRQPHRSAAQLHTGLKVSQREVPVKKMPRSSEPSPLLSRHQRPVRKKHIARFLPFNLSGPRLITTISYSLAILAIVAGGVLTLKTVQTNAESKAQVAQLKQDAEAITSGQAATAGAQASGSNSSSAVYSVAPDLPKYISIPKLGMHNVKILQVGLTKDGAVGAPVTATSTAWYNGSAKPGDTKGAMFIDGHVMGEANGSAVLTALKTLVAGDTITVTRGDDKTFTFEVVKKTTVALDAVDMAEMLRSADTTKLGLNLMTCGGTYDNKTQTFDHRTEVFAVLRGKST